MQVTELAVGPPPLEVPPDEIAELSAELASAV